MTADPCPPVLSCADAAEFERRLFGGDEAAEWTAMRAAGRAVAAGVIRDFEELGGLPEEGTVLALVGKGHNGGDALIATAEILRRKPRATATVIFALGERGLRPLAARAWRELAETGGRRVETAAPAREPTRPTWDVALDGIFGFQFRPPLPAPAQDVLRRVNALDVGLRAAVDLPSGVGEPDGFRADFTYATGSVKVPVLEAANAGRVRYLDLGFFAGGRGGAGQAGEPAPGPGTDRVLTADVLRSLSRLRPARSDKRDYGHVFILGGSRSYPGAVLMNVLGALHSGVGLVTAFVPESLAPAYAARAPEAIWVGWPETPAGGLALEGIHLLRERMGRANALAIGSGMSREDEVMALARDIVAQAEVPALIDGDGLQREIVGAAKGPSVLTPHAGEFKRLAGEEGLREYCGRTGATVVLKGPVTRVCDGSAARDRAPEVVYHSFFGGPVLSRGGSGDILAGLLAGQLALLQAAAARGEPDPAGWSPRLLAACRATVWHGLAADALARARGQTSATVTQLVDLLPAVLRGIR